MLFDKTHKVVERYLSESNSAENEFEKEINTANSWPQVTEVRIESSLPGNVHEHGKPFKITVRCHTPELPLHPTWVSLHITDSKGRGVLHVTKGGKDFLICSKVGESSFSCSFPSLKLYMGRYFINLYLSGPPNADVYERLQEIISFDVVMDGNNHEFGWLPDACTYLEYSTWTTHA